MNDGHHDPADHTHLGSHDYRTRLLTKLNCLIAVVEVAIAKIGHGLEAPGANEERLARIRTNLENTLAICKRARTTLQRAEAQRGGLGPRSRPAEGQMSYRDYVELSSIDEYRKFKTLPPIQRQELDGADIDELLRRLSQS